MAEVDPVQLLIGIFAVIFAIPIVRYFYNKYMSRIAEAGNERLRESKARLSKRVSDQGRRLSANKS